jgi:hypothetical protein
LKPSRRTVNLSLATAAERAAVRMIASLSAWGIGPVAVLVVVMTSDMVNLCAD